MTPSSSFSSAKTTPSSERQEIFNTSRLVVLDRAVLHVVFGFLNWRNVVSLRIAAPRLLEERKIDLGSARMAVREAPVASSRDQEGRLDGHAGSIARKSVLVCCDIETVGRLSSRETLGAQQVA